MRKGKAYKSKVRKCLQCGRKVLAPNGRYCEKHAVQKCLTAYEQMRNKKGEIYERWKRGIIGGVSERE